MAVFYNDTSPYYGTNSSLGYLDIMNWRSVPVSKDDILYEIKPVYQHRPDLLAYHLYNDAGLWWVFASRNPDVLLDPVFDMKPGIQIYLPQLNLMKTSLGI